jgi:hypothetical protein
MPKRVGWRVAIVLTLVVASLPLAALPALAHQQHEGTPDEFGRYIWCETQRHDAEIEAGSVGNPTHILMSAWCTTPWQQGTRIPIRMGYEVAENSYHAPGFADVFVDATGQFRIIMDLYCDWCGASRDIQFWKIQVAYGGNSPIDVYYDLNPITAPIDPLDNDYWADFPEGPMHSWTLGEMDGNTYECVGATVNCEPETTWEGGFGESLGPPACSEEAGTWHEGCVTPGSEEFNYEYPGIGRPINCSGVDLVCWIKKLFIPGGSILLQKWNELFGTARTRYPLGPIIWVASFTVDLLQNLGDGLNGSQSCPAPPTIGIGNASVQIDALGCNSSALDSIANFSKWGSRIFVVVGAVMLTRRLFMTSGGD